MVKSSPLITEQSLLGAPFYDAGRIAFEVDANYGGDAETDLVEGYCGCLFFPPAEFRR